jgi:RimJ/RimL family protein N-acetyltransferase
VRLRTPVGDLTERDVAGIGGCAVPDGRTCSNLYYRLRPEVHRHGVAVELCRAALDAAHAVAPTLPVTAFLLEHNVPSRAIAERVGLLLAWREPDAGNPDPAAVRLIYADRPLDARQTKALLAHA